jgi:hypothetical protein
MFSFVIKRLLGLIPTLLLVAVLVFLFVHCCRAIRRAWRPAPKPTTRRSRWCVPTSAWTSRCRSSS